jgi:hypothetical protein
LRYLSPPEHVGQSRRREAVDKVTALQFDRHGNRIWRDTKALLDSEHARRAVGESSPIDDLVLPSGKWFNAQTGA